MDNPEKSFKEQRVRKLTHLYYSRPEIQDAIFKFSKDREISPRYFEGFGKRPDSFQYKGDIFSLVKKGATSFHCSEELWENPLEIETGMTPQQQDKIRQGRDLLIDIDCKWIDYSKLAAKAIITSFKQHVIKNIGLKFSVTGDTPILVENNNKISLKPISEVIRSIKKGENFKVLSLKKNRKLQLSNIYNYLEHDDLVYEIKH